ncbi:putative E3 ubiquitin-protein ligase RNF216 [Monocercomonoides exilis]|uniref:putative E3 ubiquitin-protein ligase RNF216 n=1 Tax=Monocercomonoides exilis TaxID=2049356 RepID=UPI003559AB51|nr:putative E3 ubiquitin-protein ligase RNF216 [Monocercomonoides exilis]|eukprot:MONOS_3117.1-p1 / transcript=MONOS_3117.1 / gene=MONOS_3117 / organism=Monocercomonoides_exilis_PA203 / gene_product=E3 ubiquitin-protein ligase RNF216 / transcript_product=E3 ubiquitin-protein ligase RNF216 / location=Mono_scaffold00070:109517-111202(-) / protein_length=561 / sequence_SO=supercontig / SO=protein_coding / is_pseudo=false
MSTKVIPGTAENDAVKRLEEIIFEDNDDGALEAGKQKQVERPPDEVLNEDIARITVLFDDIKTDYVKALLEANWGQGDYLNKCIDFIVGTEGKYPKEPNTKKALRPVKQHTNLATCNLQSHLRYMDDKSTVTVGYRKFAMHHMVVSFPLVHQLFITAALRQHNFHLTPSWLLLWKLQKQLEEKEKEEEKIEYESGGGSSSSTPSNKTVFTPLTSLPKELNVDTLRRSILSLPNQPMQIQGSDPAFEEEMIHLKYVEDKKREAREHRLKVWRVQKQLNEEKFSPDGYYVDCPSCYDEVVSVDCVECPKGHPICRSCFKGIVKNAVSNMQSMIRCAARSDCKACYTESVIRKALIRGKTYEKWSQLNGLMTIRESGLDCFLCPFCEYPEVKTPGVPLPPIFYCKNPSCRKLICTICCKEAHKEGEKCPKLVDEENEASLIRYVQMAIDERWIRYCPKCHAPIVKLQGCNHIRCRCEHNFCCICRQSIDQDNPSTHFGQPPTYCKQFTDQDEDDEKELQEAARKAEVEWRNMHPDYKGQPVRLTELTRLSIQRRKDQTNDTSSH